MAAGLLVAAGAVLGLDWARCGNESFASARQFERMVGGLGLGATVRPRWCFVNFDPRIERCTCAEQPLPGGYCYCPEHTGTVTFFDTGALSARPKTDCSAGVSPAGAAETAALQNTHVIVGHPPTGGHVDNSEAPRP